MSLRRPIATLGLLTIAIGLGLYAWFVDRDRVSDVETNARKGKAVPVFRRAELSSIVVERAHEPTFRLTRSKPGAKEGSQGGAAPFQLDDEPDLAEVHAVDRLLSDLEFASALRTVTSSGSPIEALGLDAPRAKFTLTMGSIVETIAVGGDATTPEGAVYISVDGHGAVVVGKDAARSLLAPRDAYRNRDLVPSEFASPERIVLHGGEVREAWTRIGPSAYQGEASRLRVRREDTDSVLSAIHALRAESFIDAEKAKDATRLRLHGVRVEALGEQGANGAVEFAFGPPCEDSRSAIVYRDAPRPMGACVATGTVDRILPISERAPDAAAFTLRPDEVEEIAITGGSESVSFARKGARFVVHRGATRELDDSETRAIESLLASLLSFASPTPWRPATPPIERPPAKGAPAIAHDHVRVLRADHGGEEIVEIEAALGQPVHPPPGPDAGAAVTLVRRMDGARTVVSAEDARAFSPTSWVAKLAK